MEASEWPWSRHALRQFAAHADAVCWVNVETNPPRACQVSYADLIDMADRVSRIVSRTATPGTGVGLCLDNSLAAVACQLGVLWAGNHFVPLDQPSAQPRLSDMLDSSGIEVIFCSPDLAAQVSDVADVCCHEITILIIDDHELINPAFARFCMSDGDVFTSEAPPVAEVPPGICRRICTFHTSGTTGTPKPIHSTPEQWAAFVAAAARPYHLTATSRVFAATSAIFDPSAGLTFAALAIGAAVCLAPWSFTLQHLQRAIELTQATHACSTPSVWALYDLQSEHAPTGRGTLTTLMLGGEPMPAALIRTWLDLGVTLINTYGTTEATVYQWAHELPPHASSLSDMDLEQHARCLGVPFDGISFAVAPTAALLEDLPPCCAEQGGGGDGRDESGELVLWGEQIGGPERWGTPASQNAQCGAVPDAGEYARFHTGDLMRCHGGMIYYLGRADQQVKLHGRRIELGPIGAAICEAMQPLVRQAVVQLVDDSLHAFCVMSAPPPEGQWGVHAPADIVTTAAVRVLSARELPPHLVPPGITLLTELPRTPTGKTDARALAALARMPRAIPADAVGAHDEELSTRAPWRPQGWLGVVATCWAHELRLDVSELSASSDFRALSGDSLVALKVCARLWRHHQHDCASGTDGGTFGEQMGVFAPVHLLATPILSEYAAMLQEATPEVQGADSDALRAAYSGNGDAATCTAKGSPSAADAGLSAVDALAAQAVAAGQASLLQVLLQRHTPKVPLTVANKLLLAAVCASKGECAALMLQYGASPDASSACGTISALHSAVQRKDTTIVHRLLAACANVLAVDDNGQMALHHAARAGADSQCLKALLERSGADGDGVNPACGALDVWGRTALHWAVINGHREAIVTLVEAGSDIALCDSQSESSLDLAERRALCNDFAPSGKCDRLTLNMLKLLLPPDHAEYRTFHPEGFMDLCTHEVLEHAKRLRMSPEERKALLAMSPAEREAVGEHLMTIDELNARSKLTVEVGAA